MGLARKIVSLYHGDKKIEREKKVKSERRLDLFTRHASVKKELDEVEDELRNL